MSKKSLSDALGALRSQEEVREELISMPDVYDLFQSFPYNVQNEILSFLSGKSGLDLRYDRFFKAVFDCQFHPDRVEKLISALLGQPVKIREVLPVEGSQLVEKGSFVVMDILVELTDGSIIDVEMQKIGYRFPVQRTACYLSDIMMRQYNRVRSIRRESFSYKDIRDVYLFIIMEKSSDPFLTAPLTDQYICHRHISYDNGIALPEIEHVTYLSLDIFQKSVQNISTELDAWMTFLSRNDDKSILKLIRKYPEFIPIYHDISEFRKDPKELMNMFSEALYILDRNTERLMVDELQEERDEAIAKLDAATAKLDGTTTERDKATAERDAAYARIAELEKQLADKEADKKV